MSYYRTVLSSGMEFSIGRLEIRLLACAERLRTAALGSHLGTLDEMERLAFCIRARLDHWYPSTPESKEYDETVRKLCEMALGEYETFKRNFPGGPL